MGALHNTRLWISIHVNPLCPEQHVHQLQTMPCFQFCRQFVRRSAISACMPSVACTGASQRVSCASNFFNWHARCCTKRSHITSFLPHSLQHAHVLFGFNRATAARRRPVNSSRLFSVASCWSFSSPVLPIGCRCDTPGWLHDSILTCFCSGPLCVCLVCILQLQLPGHWHFGTTASFGHLPLRRPPSTVICAQFIAGFGSSLCLGTFAAGLADKYGRALNCKVYAVVYLAACLTKHSSNYGVLMLGRVLGGVSTSILYSVSSAVCCFALHLV